MVGTMEEQLLQLLTDTQSAEEAPRKQAEAHLLQLQTDKQFPISLATIASHASVGPNIRQSALLLLRTFVEGVWGGDELADPPVTIIQEANKEVLRRMILDLAIGSGEGDDRKVKSAARYVNGCCCG
jgi:hypothetical protein